MHNKNNGKTKLADMMTLVFGKTKLADMLTLEKVRFITKDRKNIYYYYSEERGVCKVEIGETVLYFRGLIRAYNYLNNYRIKKAIQDDFTAIIA